MWGLAKQSNVIRARIKERKDCRKAPKQDNESQKAVRDGRRDDTGAEIWSFLHHLITSVEIKFQVFSSEGLHCLIFLAQKPASFTDYADRWSTLAKYHPPRPHRPLSISILSSVQWQRFLKCREVAKMRFEVQVRKKGSIFPLFCKKHTGVSLILVPFCTRAPVLRVQKLFDSQTFVALGYFPHSESRVAGCDIQTTWTGLQDES